jgi:hypothetical protein
VAPVIGKLATFESKGVADRKLHSRTENLKLTLDCRILLIKLLVCFGLVTVTATSNPPARFSALGG